MDLLQTVRKEGSRGGRANFSWDDVKSDQHRENYLGHSLMAPVGRWQKNKDLSWYARSDNANQTEEERKRSEADARKEELRRIKEAESDAMARALGYEVPDRMNPNLAPLGGDKDVQRKIKESVDDEQADGEGGKGLGFGGYDGGGRAGGGPGGDTDDEDILEGTRGPERGGVNGERAKDRSRRDDPRTRKSDGHRERKHRRRSRSRDKDRDRYSRRHDDRKRPRERGHDGSRRKRDSRSRSRSRSPSRSRRRSRSRDRHLHREQNDRGQGRREYDRREHDRRDYERRGNDRRDYDRRDYDRTAYDRNDNDRYSRR